MSLFCKYNPEKLIFYLGDPDIVTADGNKQYSERPVGSRMIKHLLMNIYMNCSKIGYSPISVTASGRFCYQNRDSGLKSPDDKLLFELFIRELVNDHLFLLAYLFGTEIKERFDDFASIQSEIFEGYAANSIAKTLYYQQESLSRTLDIIARRFEKQPMSPKPHECKLSARFGFLIRHLNCRYFSMKKEQVYLHPLKQIIRRMDMLGYQGLEVLEQTTNKRLLVEELSAQDLESYLSDLSMTYLIGLYEMKRW